MDENSAIGSPAPESTLEVIPDGQDLVVSITLDRWTTFQVKGWNEQIVELAKAILAVESKWMPDELLAFARDVLELKPARMLPLESDPASLGDDIMSDAACQEAIRARDVLMKLRTLVRGVFYEVSERLKREAGEWGEGREPTSIQ